MKVLDWTTSWRFAWRDLRTGLRGLRLLFVCLFLGVATLAAISSLTASITEEIASQGRVLLGGDIEIAMTQREASANEKQALGKLGRFSETIRLRAMARSAKAESQAILTELKGVDSAYPLYGALALRGERYQRLSDQEVVIDASLASRLNVSAGDHLRYGEANFLIKDVIEDEPDRVGEGFTLGPVALVSMEGLRRTNLVQPGSLFESKYRLALPPNVDALSLREELEKQYAAQAWEFKDHQSAAPGTNRFLERMGQFLSLIGLTALLIAGIGIGNGVTSYLSLRRNSIAIFKVLGATSHDIARIFLLQISAVTVAATATGVIIGAITPSLIILIAGDILPVQPGFRLHPIPLLTSAAYGVLVALIFTLPPLSLARTETASFILRGVVAPRRVYDRSTIKHVLIASLTLVALVLITSPEPWFAASVLGATAAVLGILWLFGKGVRHLARLVSAPRRPFLRLALTNLHRPGAQTSTLVVALGLSLTLFVTLAAIQTSLDAEIEHTVPAQAPSLFVLDVPSSEGAKLQSIAGEAQINIVPSLRGTVVAFAGRRVADLETRPDNAWILRGERGVTYSAEIPEGSELVAGSWWPADYQGEPLVSLDADQAGALGVRLGDSISVNILGREINAKIASLRKINWGTMGFNYVMVFPPSTLQSAPHSLTATLTLPPDREEPVRQALLDAFAGASVIDVGEVVEQISGLLEQMSAAILASASITILAGVAVLVGAIAASRQTRIYDGVIMKTLGATRAQILGVQLLEYAMLAIILSAIALLLGLTAGWFVIVHIFDFSWAPDWKIIGATLAGGGALTLAIGLAGSLPIMSVRPAQALREL